MSGESQRSQSSKGRVQVGDRATDISEAALAESIMRALTPIERLLLVELFAKIRANW
jgi:hypothetical protein